MEGVDERFDFPYGRYGDDAPTTRHHRGRQRFHRMVDACIEEYVNAADRSAERSAINERLLREMRPGRFLKRRTTDGAWSYVGEEAEKTKVNKVLADEASRFRKRRRRATERIANSEQMPPLPPFPVEHNLDDEPALPSHPNPPSVAALPPADDPIHAHQPMCMDSPSVIAQVFLHHFDGDDSQSFQEDWDSLNAASDDERKQAADEGGAQHHGPELTIVQCEGDVPAGGGSPAGTTAPATDSSHSSSNGEQRSVLTGRVTLDPLDQSPSHPPQAPPTKNTRWMELLLLPSIPFQGCQVNHAKLQGEEDGVYVELSCSCDNSCRFQPFTSGLLSLGKIVTCRYHACIRQNSLRPSQSLPVKKLHEVRLLRPPRVRFKGCHVKYAVLDLETGGSVKLQCKCDNPDCGLPFLTSVPLQLDGEVFCECCSLHQPNSASQDTTSNGGGGAGGNYSPRQDGTSPDSNMGGCGGSGGDPPSSPHDHNRRPDNNPPPGRRYCSNSTRQPTGLRFEGCHFIYSFVSSRTGAVQLQCKCDNPHCRFPDFCSPLPSQRDGVVMCRWCNRQNGLVNTQEEQDVLKTKTNTMAVPKEIDIPYHLFPESGSMHADWVTQSSYGETSGGAIAVGRRCDRDRCGHQGPC